MDPSLDLVAPEPVEAGGRTPARGSQWQQLRALRPYMRPYRARLLAAVLATALSGLLGLGFPWVLGTLVDSALAGDGDIGDLNLSAALLAGIFMAQAALARVRIWNLAYAGQHIVNDLRSVLFNRMIRFPTAELDRTTTGRLSSRLISDAAFAYGSVSGAVPQLVYSAIVVVGGVILLLVVDWRLALVVLLVIPVAAIVARSYHDACSAFRAGIRTAWPPPTPWPRTPSARPGPSSGSVLNRWWPACTTGAQEP